MIWSEEYKLFGGKSNGNCKFKVEIIKSEVKIPTWQSLISIKMNNTELMQTQHVNMEKTEEKTLGCWTGKMCTKMGELCRNMY